MQGVPDPHAIASALGGVVRGDKVFAPTPGHSSRDRGTTVTIAPDAPDGCLVHSFNGGDPLAVKDELRRKGVLPERPTLGNRTPSRAPANWRRVGIYNYDDGSVDERGAPNIVYRTIRLEADGQRKRFMAERRTESGEWVSGLGDLDRFPYRFSDLCAAAEQARQAGETDPPIYFVEGERKADRLVEMGFLATAIAFGANGWRAEYAEAFRGATLIILPDNDEPGRKFAETVKASVEEHGATAHIIALPGLPPKGDIMDWGGTADDLRALATKAIAGSLLTLPTLDLGALATVTPKPKAFVVERLAPRGEVTLFTGAGSAGKSLLGQQLVTCAAAGLPCLGLDVVASPAIYMTCEDDHDQLHWRQSKICARLGVNMADLDGRLHLSSLRGELDNELATFPGDGTLKPSPAFFRLVDMVKATRASLVVLDNVAHLFPGNENDRIEVTRFVNLLNRLAGGADAAILLLGHPNKSGDDYSGSTAWLNAVRSQITLEHDTMTDMRTLTVGKANYARKGDSLRFAWDDWSFVLEQDLAPDTARALADTALANAQNAAFLRCLEACTAKGRNVSHQPGSNYAPKIFAGMAEAKGIKKPAFEAAMERLLHIEAIELDVELWAGANRHPKRGIRAKPSAA